MFRNTGTTDIYQELSHSEQCKLKAVSGCQEAFNTLLDRTDIIKERWEGPAFSILAGDEATTSSETCLWKMLALA